MITTAPDLDSAYALSPEQIERFRRDGYIKLKDVFSRETLDCYSGEITRLVQLASKDALPLEQRSAYGKAFLQIMNLWRESDIVREFVFGQRLARIATELLGTRGVRIYHDQALYKEPGGGYTPWHVDQHYWPFSSEKSVTAWIPLQPVPLESGPLSFSIGSQRIKIGRELEISEESETKIQEQLKLSNLAIDETPYDLGEVSFHYGFTFHRAGPNKLPGTRKVMTIIYMDQDMRLREPANKNELGDRAQWCPGVEIGDVIDSPLSPILYSR